MSPNLKPLLLPQLVEERRKWEVQQSPDCERDLSYVYYTTNSSSSDVASPLTPTFSPNKGHFRVSSSASSLDLPPNLQESPVSPPQPAHTKSAMRSLPDVQEEPLEPEDNIQPADIADHFGLYSCLCDQPCEHRNSSEDIMFHGNLVSDYDLDYDMGFLSDGDVSVDGQYPRKKSGSESPFTGLTSRIGSRLPSMTRWRAGSRSSSTRRGNPILSPSTELSLESVVLSGTPSSRSSSMSAPSRPAPERLHELSVLPTPALSFYESTESVNLPSPIEIDPVAMAYKERSSLERERGLATTPLLPPLMTSPLSKPPPESPLQSPTVAPSSASTEIQSPPPLLTSFPRPSLSTKPSVSSFRFPTSPDLPLPLPAMLQEHDEWSDRLGHANFTITPLPYQPETVNLEALKQLRNDWDTARCNYTKHLVRTGENYGETSKIYALTEAKWAETEKRWRSMHDNLMEQIVAITGSDPTSPTASRSRSRGRGRTRASSGGAALMNRPPVDDIFAGMQWRRLEDGMPSAVPRLLDADGKFPSRGDEDIVGPMQRDEVMLRTHSEERKTARFWKSLAGKVGLRK